MNALLTRLASVPWGSLPRGLWHSWRRSLQLRTVITSVLLSGIAIGLVGAYMSFSISNDLFASRRDQVLAESARAQAAAQRLFDASDATDRAATQYVLNAARTTVQESSSSTMIAAYRAPGQEPSLVAPQDFTSPELASGIITPSLREQVQLGAGNQFWQSVNFGGSANQVPGIVVGALTVIPSVGSYELYIGYSLAEAQRTLSFVQQVLWVSGISLLIIIGLIAWFVARLVVNPIRVAATTSIKLAEGDRSVRIPVEGEDDVATLARSFNQMAASLERQVSELEDLSMMQQRFVSDVSHELRTPLTTVKLADALIYKQRKKMDANTQRGAEALHIALDRFEKLLTDLLEISRYDAKNAVMEMEPVNIASLVADVVTDLKDLAKEHKTKVILQAPGGHGEAVVDPRRIRRIVSNLLGNAIEHGEKKPIEIWVDSDANAVAVSVRDHGIGMTEKDVAKVFERFWRADPARTRRIGGTGLGLAISREDALAHNGELDVWSRPGEGSVFRLTLPRVPGVPVTSWPLPLEPQGEAS